MDSFEHSTYNQEHLSPEIENSSNSNNHDDRFEHSYSLAILVPVCFTEDAENFKAEFEGVGFYVDIIPHDFKIPFSDYLRRLSNRRFDCVVDIGKKSVDKNCISLTTLSDKTAFRGNIPKREAIKYIYKHALNHCALVRHIMFGDLNF